MKKLLIIIITLLLTGCSAQASETDELLIIAHRGDSSEAPEHTMPSYEKAINSRADFIEIDLRMTKDNQLIAMHDETVDRTTNGLGKVSDYTLDELKALDAGSWFNEEYKGEEILTLQEILDRFKTDTNYYIETKTVDNLNVMEEKLLKILSDRQLLDKVVIQSFSSESLKLIHKLNKDIPLVQLCKDSEVPYLKENEIRKYAIGIGLNGKLVDETFVERVHEANLVVHTFFDKNNEKKQIEEVVSYGVDGVFTDYLVNANKYQ
ncbi:MULTISPECIES: glycerophosphodiester phosphodiesterase family protein [unclassified Bacillus (in: firmicutes)]|uniref:glycerophosphodiester phosphodiesterase family protein n=1 Tax=unclassified Bacillus (in: firmicutes) TaxID=185979 RepID=UPI001BE7E9C0|nr:MULTISPECIES: glycerophosphodiester phosphodiesterase family protein [unclassified Bacillus (in: firmicutes)]MBT2615085.1 glycerophosphodiester phosphodiesterase [Bacillus sp. ISL-78]MBT2627702.1 glycerophosphodiester phosphodiesterase [Bacillus sp. ISL-101]MBT2716905.1 glycerophosphodiester phosphodiesterase [Bacillus sp. ISL-57]